MYIYAPILYAYTIHIYSICIYYNIHIYYMPYTIYKHILYYYIYACSLEEKQ